MKEGGRLLFPPPLGRPAADGHHITEMVGKNVT
jgi:hypothetical protein